MALPGRLAAPSCSIRDHHRSTAIPVFPLTLTIFSGSDEDPAPAPPQSSIGLTSTGDAAASHAVPVYGEVLASSGTSRPVDSAPSPARCSGEVPVSVAASIMVFSLLPCRSSR